MNINKYTKHLFLALVFITLSILNLCIGEVNLSPLEVLTVQPYSIHYDIIFNVRFPTLVSAACAGGLLAIAGQLMQTYFQNYLAGPYVLGISSGATLGVAFWTMGVALIPSLEMLTHGSSVFALLGALLICFLLFSLIRQFKDKVFILIAGLLFSHLCSGLISMLMSQSSESALRDYTLWSLGSFSRLDFNSSLLFLLISFLLLILFFLCTKALSLFTLGEKNAYSLGLNVKRYKYIFMTLMALTTTVVTIFCGPITFVGLIIPNFSRMILKSSNQRALMFFNVLSGACLCMSLDLLSDVFPSFLQPTNSLLGLIGAPFIFYLLINKEQKRVFA